MIFLKRNNEWCSIQPNHEDETMVIWFYGEDKHGTDRMDCPRNVMSSQVAAHISKGWNLIFSLEEL